MAFGTGSGGLRNDFRSGFEPLSVGLGLVSPFRKIGLSGPPVDPGLSPKLSMIRASSDMLCVDVAATAYWAWKSLTRSSTSQRYDADHEVRRVRSSGEMKWRGDYVFIGEALAGELIGLAERQEGRHIVRFRGRDLGLIDHQGPFLRFGPPRASRRNRP
jgi:hypothetical protein